MRLPIRSEPDAFRLTWAFVLLVAASVLLGVATEPAIGVGLFAAVALGALTWEFTTADPERGAPLREAAHEHHPEAAPDRWRILVIANESLGGAGLRDEVRRRAERNPELIVLAPVLLSRTHFAVTDVDRERAEAKARLDETLAWAAREGIPARGVIGDHVDPLAAVEDELRLYGADEVLVVTHPAERANWIELGMLDRLRAELDLPITHLVVDREQDRVTSSAS
jgi:hypothetical protein